MSHRGAMQGVSWLKIRTQFVASMVLFGLTFSVIAASVFMTSREVARLEGQERIAADLGRGASDLGLLSGDYILYREDQQRVRWEAAWTSLSKQAARLDPVAPDERSLTGNLRVDLVRLRGVFEEAANAPTSTREVLIPVLWSRMAVQSQSMTFHASRLAEVLRDRKGDIQRQNIMLIVALLGMSGAYLVVNYLIVYRRTLRSLTDVQAAIEIIGRGDLDHVIPVKHNDEIGSLSRSFNRMTTDLKSVTASKSRLEAEIAERETAEEALRRSIKVAEELSEAREQELATTRQLLEVAHGIGRWTDMEDLATGLAQILLKLTRHTRVSVGAWRAEELEVEILASEGVSALPDGERWPIDSMSEAARQAIAGRGIEVRDGEMAPVRERGEATSECGPQRGLFVPLVQRDDVLGLIVIDDPGEPAEFSEREIQLVQGVAVQAAVAFENARLFAAQRQIADRLQEALLVLPDALPGIEFVHAYHSATEATRVGGDFYDLFELDHGHVGVVIGDVSGKGLEAAVLTSMVKNTIRAHANEAGKTPGQILELTNDVVYRATRPEAFATVFFGILDCSDGRFVYSNAGHTASALLRAHGPVAKLGSTGPLLGAFATTTFRQADAWLDCDDILFLYTDGLTEARRDGELYGENRLIDVLESAGGLDDQELVAAVLSDVLDFSGMQLRDDVAILCLRRIGRGTQLRGQPRLPS